MSKRKEFREGKTKGNTKPLPKGPRPNIGPPPPQHPKKLTKLLYIVRELWTMEEH